MRYTIKWRFVLKLAVVVLVAATAVFFVHRWQVGRQVTAFLHQADLARDAAKEAQKAGDAERALAQREREVEFVHRYAMARPDDNDARDRLGRLMAETARTSKQAAAAYYFLEDTLRRDPDRDDLRRFTAELAIIFRQYKEAREHLETLNRKRPGDGELESLLALCIEREKKPAKGPDGTVKKWPEAAADWYAKSTEHRYDLLGSYLGLANLRRRELGQSDKGDELVGEMVAKNKDNFRAHLSAAAYWREYGKPEKAAAHVAEARKLMPDERDVLIEAAALARSQAREAGRERTTGAKEKAEKLIAEARQLLTRALEQARKLPGVYMALASLEAEAGQLPAAIEAIRKGLAEVPNSSDLLLALLDYQYRDQKLADMKETLAKLKTQEKGIPQAVIAYHDAQILTLQEKWNDAAAVLTRAAPAMGENHLLARQANLLLARCYEELGEHAKRLAPCTNALNSPTPLTSADPLWVPATLAMAETQSALGQAGEALATYRQLAALAPGAWLQVARLEMLRTLTAPKEKWDWRAVEEALAKAAQAAEQKILPDDLELQLLRVAVLRHQEKLAEARKLVDTLHAARPKERTVWLELAFQDARENGPERGLATLAAAEKEVGDSLELRLARAALLAEGKDADAPAKIAALAAGGEKFGVRQNRRLLRGLAEVASRAGADEVAGRLWDDLARAKPFDLTVHLVRFDRAARARNVAEMEKILGSIREIDGENGSSTRMAQAVLWVQQSVEKNDRAPRDRALALLERLEGEQGNSPVAGRAALAQARIHDLNGNEPAALEKYRHANSRGVLPPDAAPWYIELLRRSGDLVEADRLLKEFRSTRRWGPDLERLATAVSFQIGDLRAVLGRAEALANSKNYGDQILLGRSYWLDKDQAKAEARFREAVRLAPDAADAWLILIEYLVATDRRPEAEKVFGEAREKVKAADRAVFVAQGHTRLGQIEKAVEAHKRASAENPNDVRTLMTEAEFLLRIGKLAEARGAFERVLGLPGATEADRQVAEQRLLVAVAADPNYEVSRQAVQRLAARPPGPNETPAQKRARGAILALQRDRPSKLEAIRLLEENTQGRTPNEQFLVARLHLAVGNRDRFVAVMEDLLKVAQNRTPLFVGFYTLWLIQERRFGDAQKWVEFLEKADPKSLPTAELKARLAFARNPKDHSATLAALSPYFDDPKVPPLLLSQLCEQVGLYEQAEAFLKKHIEQQKGAKPEVVLSLAAYYGRRGEPAMTAKAMQIWEESQGKFPAPLLGSVAVAVLYHAASPAAADLNKVADWLKEESAKARGNDRAGLLQHYAAVLNLQGKFAESATVYTSAIAENRRDALAMNNLAYLLSAVHKRHDEALRLVNDAKQIVGPTNSDLLDTEALILIEKGEVAKAQKIMEVVAAENPIGVSFYHLALAEHKLKNALEATRAWRRAKELGVKLADLHPLERKAFEELGKAYP